MTCKIDKNNVINNFTRNFDNRLAAFFLSGMTAASLALTLFFAF